MILNIFSILLLLVMLIIFASSVVFVAAMLLNLYKNHLISLQTKLLWGALIVFLPLIGAIIYFFTFYSEPRRRIKVGEYKPEE